MKKLLTYFSKRSLSIENGSTLDRSWTDQGPMKSRKLFAVLFCLLFVGVGNAWGDTNIDLTQSSMGVTATSYATSAGSATIGNVAFAWDYIIKNGTTKIQLQASNGVLYNTSLVPGKITQVVISQSDNTNKSTIYFGTSAQPTTNSAEFSTNGTNTMNAPSNTCMGYFKITRGKNAAYYTQVRVTYTPATITLSESSISGLNYNVGGGPSAAQSFTVSGSNIPANLTVTAPTNFEVSLDNSSWGTSKTINVTLTGSASAGTLSSTTVYVRLASGKSAGSYNGNVSIAMAGCNTISGVNPKTVAVSGTVSAASCTSNPGVSAGSNSAVTTTTATVSCSSGLSSLGSAGCSISSYGFVIGSSANPAIGGSGVTQHEVGTTYTTTGTAFSKDLTSLTPGATYYVRPYATNGNGTGYGTQTSFTMLNVYTLTFKEYVGGGAASGSPSTGTVVQNATSFSYGATPPSKTGYTIEGFYTNTSASSGVKVANSSREFGTSVEGWTNGSNQYTKGANANLYINWNAKTTAITLNKNNEDASGSNAGSVNYTYGESTKDSYTSATRTGYTLNGYYTATSAGTKILNADGTIAGSSIVVSTVTYTDGSGNWAYDGTSLTLYAQWTIKSYSVTWKVNNTDYTTGTPTSSVNHGSKVTKLPTAPSPASYCGDKFMGWTDADGGVYTHGTSNLYTSASQFPAATGAQTFYAVFADYDD